MWNYEKWVHHCADINFFITDEDRHYAIKHFNLEKHKCHTITYGMELNDKPSIAERLKAKKILQETYPINDLDRIMLFNGTLDYKPNLDALDVILERINPLLLNQKKIGYKIIICGKNLPLKYDQLTKYKSKNIIYAGFVDDINLYFEGADIFLNPLVDGGGIKTKLVEALGYNLCCVSTKSGAIGVDPAITGDKLWITVDNDWQNFTNSIFEINIDKNIPPAFFNHFYWGNIARKAAAALIDLMSEIK